MTPQNIIALAEALEWERQGAELVWWNRKLGKYATLPELRERFNDLNAMHEAVETIRGNPDLEDAFSLELATVVHKAPHTREGMLCFADYFELASATAAQRAEAFLKVRKAQK